MQADRPSEETLNLKHLFLRYVRFWPFYVGSLFFFFAVAIFLYSFLTPAFKIKGRILIKDKNNTISSNETFDESLDLFRTKRNLENEMGILRSFTFINKVISQLPFHVSYFERRWLKKKEMYLDCPFEVKLDTPHTQLTGNKFWIKYSTKNTFSLSVSVSKCYPKKIDEENGKFLLEDYSFEGEFKNGEPIVTPYFSFYLQKRPLAWDSLEIGKSYCFVLHTNSELADTYFEKLKLEQENVESSIITLTLKGEVIQKECDFLNQLCSTYVNSGLEEKNVLAERTIQYINGQLSSISDSLENSNKNLMEFTSKNQVTNIDAQTKHNYDKLYHLEKERAALLVKNKYYHYLFDYINSASMDSEKLVTPSTIGIEDPLLTNLLSNLASLNQERASLLFSAQGDNPNLQMIDRKIENTKKALRENVKSILESSKLALQDNEANIAPIMSTLNSLPTSEREMLNLKREYDHFEQIYNYLMEKRSEAEIAKASNTPHHSILDAAKPISKEPVMPNKKLFGAVALMLSFLFPTLCIAIFYLVKSPVQFPEDLAKISSSKVIETLFEEKAKTPAKIAQIIHLPTFESFKRIKSFLEKKKDVQAKTQAIGISSSGKNEGKTFVATRLGLAFSQAHISTVLVDFNFIRPNLGTVFGLHPQKSLNDFFSENVTVGSVTYPTSVPNLAIIPCSHHASPSDLITKEKMDALFQELRSRYTTIIVDSAPCLLFSDYDELIKYLDVHLFVVRKQESSTFMFSSLDSYISTYAQENSYLVFNGETNNSLRKAIERY
jgi:uncharacterized protein involved in exopolysaccharide biosynthesis/Mrp family chromosome partitioning ATPase